MSLIISLLWYPVYFGKEFISDNLYKFVGVLILTGLLGLTLGNVVLLIHHSPVGGTDMRQSDVGQNDTNIITFENGSSKGVHNFSNLSNVTKNNSLGLTNGDRTESLFAKDDFHGGVLVLNLKYFLYSFFYVGFLAFVHYFYRNGVDFLNSHVFCRDGVAFSRIDQQKVSAPFELLFVAIFTFGSYIAFIYILFSRLLPIEYIYAEETIPVVTAYQNGLIHPGFIFLIILQGAMFGVVCSIWTRPLNPKKSLEERNESDSNMSIRRHISNWRQYGSWIATILGGLFLSTIVLIIFNGTSYGTLVVRNMFILFGGTVVLSLGYITLKLAHLENVVNH